MADTNDTRSLLVAVDGQRRQMHHQTEAALAAVLLGFGATIHPTTLRDQVDPSAPYQVRRTQAQVEIERQAVALGVTASWTRVVRDAHTAAVTGGVAAAGHLVSAGQLPVAPASAPAVPDPFNPAAWIRDQQGGMGGDIATLLSGDDADDVEDADLSSVIAAGMGAVYGLDVQTSWAWLLGTAQQYSAFGERWVDWNTMGDNRVCARCLRIEEDSPHRVDAVPDVPHGGCRCWITPSDGPRR